MVVPEEGSRCKVDEPCSRASRHASPAVALKRVGELEVDFAERRDLLVDDLVERAGED